MAWNVISVLISIKFGYIRSAHSTVPRNMKYGREVKKETTRTGISSFLVLYTHQLNSLTVCTCYSVTISTSLIAHLITVLDERVTSLLLAHEYRVLIFIFINARNWMYNLNVHEAWHHISSKKESSCESVILYERKHWIFSTRRNVNLYKHTDGNPRWNVKLFEYNVKLYEHLTFGDRWDVKLFEYLISGVKWNVKLLNLMMTHNF